MGKRRDTIMKNNKITINFETTYSPSGCKYDRKMVISRELYDEFLEYASEGVKHWIEWHNVKEYEFKNLKKNENIVFLSDSPNISFYHFLKSKNIKFADRLYNFNIFLELK
jgi:hypothetical protein